MREDLYTVSVDWADHKENCTQWYVKVITCFICGAKGNIVNKESSDG